MTVGPVGRPALRSAVRILTAYGIAGAVVAGLSIVVLVVGVARLSGLGDRLGTDVGGVSAALERTATVLDQAAASARSFGTTIDSSTTALGTAANDLRQIVPRLRDIETQANAINILGSHPLEPVAGLFGQIAVQLTDLDAQLDGMSANLTGNRAALETNATSLAALGTEVRSLAGRLGTDAVSRTLDDARWLLVALLGIGAAGAAVPAVGALVLAWWLRRELPSL